MRSGSSEPTSFAGSAGRTTRSSGVTSAAPITTHVTWYSPASVAVTSWLVVVVPAPDGEIAIACVNEATGLSYASKARQDTPSGWPASVVGESSRVITRAGGPATIWTVTGSRSISARLGAEHRT